MSEIGLFSLGDFAKISRLTRDTLLHYDRIGLLAPVSRGDNNYRYYSGNQLYVVNVIRTMQQLGMTLEEIKGLRDLRSPELLYDILQKQIGKIDRKIEDWVRARKLLLTFEKCISSVSTIDESVVTIRFMPAEAIVLGDLNDYSRGRTMYDTLLSFYQDISEKYPSLDLNYPAWAVFTAERVKSGELHGPDRYYFYNPEGHDRRPAALYAVGYTRCGYGNGIGLYQKMIDYIDKNGFEICGNAYEEYPLNELCVTDANNYLLRLMITVREK